MLKRNALIKEEHQLEVNFLSQFSLQLRSIKYKIPIKKKEKCEDEIYISLVGSVCKTGIVYPHISITLRRCTQRQCWLVHFC